MSTTLPSIKSCMTPEVTSYGVSPPPSTSLRRSRTSIVSQSLPTIYGIYPPYLPPADDIPAKVNPARPLPPYKMTMSHETILPHFSNHYRTVRMKQRDHYRFHSVWSKYFYGSPADKQQQGAYMRAVLKQQMEDKDAERREDFMCGVADSEQALQYDLQCHSEDAARDRAKRLSLTAYRDTNKQMMEFKWSDQKEKKKIEDSYDREQLLYNPINWSHTLK